MYIYIYASYFAQYICQKILYCFVELGKYDAECPLFWPYVY